MAITTIPSASEVQKWDANFFEEYVRESGFRPYMGRGMNNAIVTKYELTSGGKYINIPLVTRLKGSGVTGHTKLAGQEEALGNFNHQIQVEWRRNAVEIPKDVEHWTEMDLRRAARDMLKIWCMERLRDDVIDALGSVWHSGAAYNYAAASEAAKDAWLAANADRVLFGSAKSNNASNDHSAALALIDNVNDKLTPAVASLAKRMAKTADPHIRPLRVEGGREYYVMFCPSQSFRDLKENSTMTQANREARARDVSSNPLFQDGDLIYDGIIFREIPEIGTISNGAIDCAPNYLCGVQALGVAWGQEPQSRVKKEDDYGFFYGVAIEECVGVDKLFYNGVQHGVVTVYTAGVADS